LTNGINWRGDYVAVFDEKAETMSLQGWATINNQTNTDFEDAELSVVAGQIGNANNRNRNRFNNNRNNAQRRGGIEAGSAERIGDNYIYPLPGRTTLATKQTKQISFVDADAMQAVSAKLCPRARYASIPKTSAINPNLSARTRSPIWRRVLTSL